MFNCGDEDDGLPILPADAHEKNLISSTRVVVPLYHLQMVVSCLMKSRDEEWVSLRSMTPQFDDIAPLWRTQVPHFLRQFSTLAARPYPHGPHFWEFQMYSVDKHTFLQELETLLKDVRIRYIVRQQSESGVVEFVYEGSK